MKKTIILSFLFLSLHIFAQYETSHWFFGTHAGLDFQSGAPVPETGGQMNTEEGCSSISDACGNLLMYTNGVTIYNANHQIMYNGDGLHGSDSSTQSGIIVPKPGDPNIYYVFTVDEAYAGVKNSRGLKYTIVDMTLDGGLGGVPDDPTPNPSNITYKNIPLIDHATEKVTAVVSSDGSSIWVLTLAPSPNNNQVPYTTTNAYSNAIYAFKVTTSGIQNTAVVSVVNINAYGGVGYMKASPDGTKLAVANMYDNTAYLLDFDSTSGIASNPVSLFSSSGVNPYGLEFSPDSSKLYISDRGSRLYQFDLIDNNHLVTISREPNYRSALQLALDGKIYQTFTKDYGIGSNRMSVIEKPNEVGTNCNYRYKSITLPSGMTARQGLPPFIQSYFLQIGGLKNLAVSINQNLEINSNRAFTSIDWDFGDGETAITYPDNPPNNTHSEISHTFQNPGKYTVTATIHLTQGCDVNATMEVIIYPNPDLEKFEKKLEFCDNNKNGKITLNLHDLDEDIINLQTTPGTHIVRYYPTEIDAKNETNELTDPYTNPTPYNEVIYIRVDNLNTLGKSINSLVLAINRLPEIYPVSPYGICDIDEDGVAEFDLSTKVPEILNGRSPEDYEVKFYPTKSDAENETNEIQQKYNNTIPFKYINTTPFNETIWYKLTDVQHSCVNYDELSLQVHPLININMQDKYYVCRGGTIQLEAPTGFISYDWSDGQTGRVITIDKQTTLELTVTDSNHCSKTKEISVIESDIPDNLEIEIHDFLDNNYIVIKTQGIGDYEYSLDNQNFQDSNLIDHLTPGTYTIYVRDKNGCGTITKTIDIIDAPHFFTPNQDGHNDYWQAIHLRNKPGSYINIYDRYGKLIKVLLPTEQGWDGTFEGHPMPATDYWFVAFIKENNNHFRKMKGHFSLKR